MQKKRFLANGDDEVKIYYTLIAKGYKFHRDCGDEEESFGAKIKDLI